MDDAKRSVNADFKNLPDSASLSATVFFVFTLFGGLFIVSAKFLGYAQGIVTGVPVAIMIVYALLLRAARRLRLRDDQSGDNLYYMGFLFTLVSLGVSLFQFSILEGVEEIIRNFGVAISTTMVGIALRIVFNMLREDPAEVERTARLELADAARRVRRELEATVMEFSYFRRSAQQSINEGYMEIRRNVDETSKAILEGLNSVLSASTAPLQAAALKSSETIDAVTNTTVRSLETTASNLSEHSTKVGTETVNIAASLDEFSKRLQAIQTPDKIIEIKLNPAIQGIGKSIANFDKSLEAQNSRLDTTLGELKAALATTIKALEGVHAQDKTHVGLISESLKLLQNTAAAMSNSLSGLRSESTENAQRVNELAEYIHRLASVSLEQAQRVDQLIEVVAQRGQGAPEARPSSRSFWSSFGGSRT